MHSVHTKTGMRSRLSDVTLALRAYNLQTFLASSLLALPLGMRKSLMPRTLKLPDDVRVLVNDLATVQVNIPDQYVRREYEALPTYAPRPGWTVIDVGAYVGLFSLHAARIVGDGGLVAAFEPNPDTYCWLLRNVDLNRARNVKTFNLALGDAEGTADFYTVKNRNIGASSLIEKHVKNTMSTAENYAKTQVSVTTLDNIYFKNKVFQDRSISLMKVDVEGYELNVLKGSEKLLSKSIIQRLIVEVHTDVVQGDAVQRFLRDYNYKLDKKLQIDHVKEIHYYQ